MAQRRLNERSSNDCVTSEKDILEYAKYIGIDVNTDKHLLWLAEDGLKCSLPKPWAVYENKNGDVYYYNPDTDISTWEHPVDSKCKKIVAELKGLQHEPFDCQKPLVPPIGLGLSKMPLKPLRDIPSSKSTFPVLSSLSNLPAISGNEKLSPLAAHSFKTPGSLTDVKSTSQKTNKKRAAPSDYSSIIQSPRPKTAHGNKLIQDFTPGKKKLLRRRVGGGGMYSGITEKYIASSSAKEVPEINIRGYSSSELSDEGNFPDKKDPFFYGTDDEASDVSSIYHSKTSGDLKGIHTSLLGTKALPSLSKLEKLKPIKTNENKKNSKKQITFDSFQLTEEMRNIIGTDSPEVSTKHFEEVKQEELVENVSNIKQYSGVLSYTKHESDSESISYKEDKTSEIESENNPMDVDISPEEKTDNISAVLEVYETDKIRNEGNCMKENDVKVDNSEITKTVACDVSADTGFHEMVPKVPNAPHKSCESEKTMQLKEIDNSMPTGSLIQPLTLSTADWNEIKKLLSTQIAVEKQTMYCDLQNSVEKLKQQLLEREQKESKSISELKERLHTECRELKLLIGTQQQTQEQHSADFEKLKEDKRSCDEIELQFNEVKEKIASEKVVNEQYREKVSILEKENATLVQGIEILKLEIKSVLDDMVKIEGSQSSTIATVKLDMENFYSLFSCQIKDLRVDFSNLNDTVVSDFNKIKTESIDHEAIFKELQKKWSELQSKLDTLSLTIEKLSQKENETKIHKSPSNYEQVPKDIGIQCQISEVKKGEQLELSDISVQVIGSLKTTTVNFAEKSCQTLELPLPCSEHGDRLVVNESQTLCHSEQYLKSGSESGDRADNQTISNELDDLQKKIQQMNENVKRRMVASYNSYAAHASHKNQVSSTCGCYLGSSCSYVKDLEESLYELQNKIHSFNCDNETYHNHDNSHHRCAAFHRSTTSPNSLDFRYVCATCRCETRVKMPNLIAISPQASGCSKVYRQTALSSFLHQTPESTNAVTSIDRLYRDDCRTAAVADTHKNLTAMLKDMKEYLHQAERQNILDKIKHHKSFH